MVFETRCTQGAYYDRVAFRLGFDVEVSSGDESCFERQHEIFMVRPL